MLTIDMILAMSEAELRAANIYRVQECLMEASCRLNWASVDLDSNASALAAETVPESTGTAVDEIYDFEVETEDGQLHNCCPVCGGDELRLRKGRWECVPCEEHIYRIGF